MPHIKTDLITPAHNTLHVNMHRDELMRAECTNGCIVYHTLCSYIAIRKQGWSFAGGFIGCIAASVLTAAPPL